MCHTHTLPRQGFLLEESNCAQLWYMQHQTSSFANPCIIKTNIRSLTSMQMCHTHTPCRSRVLFLTNEISCSLMHELLYTFDTVTWQGFTQYIRKLTMRPLEELGSHHGSSCSRPFAICRQTHPMPWLPSMSRKVGPLELKL